MERRQATPALRGTSGAALKMNADPLGQNRDEDVRSPDVFETPLEEEVLADQLSDDTRTVSPGEEGPVTQGFQHGSWKYEHDAADKPLVGTTINDLDQVDTSGSD